MPQSHSHFCRFKSHETEGQPGRVTSLSPAPPVPTHPHFVQRARRARPAASTSSRPRLGRGAAGGGGSAGCAASLTTRFASSHSSPRSWRVGASLPPVLCQKRLGALLGPRWLVASRDRRATTLRRLPAELLAPRHTGGCRASGFIHRPPGAGRTRVGLPIIRLGVAQDRGVRSRARGGACGRGGGERRRSCP